MTDKEISPYRIEIPDADLADLAARLSRPRWPDELPGTRWEYGVSLDRVRQLADHWRHRYQWRDQERRLNDFPQFTTVIDGQLIHFLHVRSPEPGAFPLVLTHGWPGSVAEFTEILGPLTNPRGYGGDPADAFHLVVPSLPGYGFSGPTTEPGWDVARIARAWAELMARLGYQRYGAQGGDWGARVSPQLGRVDPDHVAGVHVNALVALPGGDPAEQESLSPEDQTALEGVNRWWRERSGYSQIQATRPQTLAYALSDSPVGLLAWNLEWFDAYGTQEGEIDPDAILTNVTIYWLTGTAGSAARLYKEAAASWGQPSGPSGVPTGVAVFPGDSTVRRFAERDHLVTRWRRFDRGGHFAAMQAPDLLVGDVRDFFRELR
jgi:epoxide hydrolase